MSPGITLMATAILAWNQGLASKIGTLVSQLTK
jgi:hypothetical protein